MLYAPGFYTGYDVKTLPGIREAIEQRDWREADTQIGRVATALNALSGEIDARPPRRNSPSRSRAAARKCNSEGSKPIVDLPFRMSGL